MTSKEDDVLAEILHKFAGCGYPHPDYMFCEWCDSLPKVKQAILKIVEEAKYQVLADLLEWQELWDSIHKEPFNWYGAVKAMQVMKDPQKPFIKLKRKTKGIK